MLIIWLLACSDPEIFPAVVTSPVTEKALDAFDQAMAARMGEDWPKAEAALLLAIERDPESPSLWLWLAQTYLDSGRSAEARGVLDEAARLFPENADCLYNRAALRARLGDIGGAADDLRSLKSMGSLDPLETGSDQDFSSLRDDPVYADLVIQPRVGVHITREEGAVLLGDAWRMELRIAVPLEGDIEVLLDGNPSELLQLESVVEQEIRESTHERTLDLSMRWRAVAAGHGSAGPWTIRSGVAEATVEAVVVEVAELGSWTRAVTQDASGALPIPSVLLSRMDEKGLAIREPWAAMTMESGQRVRTQPEVPLVTLELRSPGGEVATAQAFRGAHQVERLEQGKVVFSSQLP